MKNLFFCSDMVKISGPNRSTKITDHFYAHLCKCRLLHNVHSHHARGSTKAKRGKKLADRFREHLRDVEKKETDASKPVPRHFNLLNCSHHIMTIFGQSLSKGTKESGKSLEEKFILKLDALYQHGINERLSYH